MRDAASRRDPETAPRRRRWRAARFALGIGAGALALSVLLLVTAGPPAPRPPAPTPSADAAMALARIPDPPSASRGAATSSSAHTRTGSPPDTGTRPDWSRWLDAAHAGDAVAACRLSGLLDDCRLAREVERMIDTQVSMAASGDAEAATATGEIAALEASLDPLRTRCAGLPAGLHPQNWNHLMQAAIAGHEPSMLRFLVDPPLDMLDRDGRDAARRAYRANAALFLSALLQRASPDALALAYRVAQGEEFLPDVAIAPRDAAAAVRYGTALLVLREDDPATWTGVETALGQIDAAAARIAQSEGQRLVLPFLQRRDGAARSPAHDEDECRRGWPGTEIEGSTLAW